MLGPDCWLSLHELPVLLFLATHGKAKEAQDRIVRHVENWREFLRLLSQNKTGDVASIKAEISRLGLEIRDLPEELQYYLKNGKVKPVYLESEGPKSSRKISTKDAAEIWLRKAIEQTDRLLRGFDKESQYDFKLGKNKKAKFHHGYIARWLVRDFMRFQQSNKDVRDKWGKIKSAPDYMALQTALTCFHYRKESVSMEVILRNARLIDGKTYDHPFLSKVVRKASNMASLDAFFKAYLRERNEWLRTIDGDKAYPLRRLYHRGENKSEVRLLQTTPAGYLRQFAEKLLDEPVNLPRNLFEPLVWEVVKTAFPEHWQKESMDNQRVNSTWLMMKALEWSGDCSQWFYRLPHSMSSEKFGKLFALLGTMPRYDAKGVEHLEEVLKIGEGTRKRELQDLLRRDRDFKKLSLQGKKEEIDRRMEALDQMYHRLLRQYGEYEKDIRHVRMQDMALLGTLPSLLKIPANNIRLGDMKPETGKEEGDFILNEMVPLSMTVVLPQQEGKMVLTGTMKRKNYGNFQRMRSDVRLPSYLRWMKEVGWDTVSYDLLEREFEYYDRVARPDIFRWVYKLERKVLRKNPDLKTEDSSGHVKFWNIASNATQNEWDCLVLTILRNAFSHQFYPDFLPDSSWKENDVKQYSPLLQGVRREILDSFMKKSDGEKLFIQTLHEYAKRVFQTAITLVGKK